MNDTEIFEGKSFSGLLKDIHDNALVKRTSINDVVKQLMTMIKTSDDAIVFAPIIREFMDVGVKNDDQVIKIATIVQRMVSMQQASASGELLSEAEKDQLLKNAMQEIEESVTAVTDNLVDANDKLEAARGKNS